MASEQDKEFQRFQDSIEDPKVIPIDAVYIDFQERTARLLTDDLTVAILKYRPDFQLQLETLPSLLINLLAADVTEGELEPSTFAQELKERRHETIALSGKIKGPVKPGKLDRSGRPTAWSKFAAHWKGERDARMLLATFHGWTAEVALSLKPESAVAATGYYHEAGQPGRLDTYSIIALHQWPGKPAEAPQSHSPRR